MTVTPARRPARCLPFTSWPAQDRLGWLEATRTGDLLLDDGPGAALRPNTLRRHRGSYGRFLAWLADQGLLDPDLPAGDRATPAAVAAYVAELQARNASGTVLVRLQSLAVVLRWLAPEQERPWLKRILARLAAMAQPVRDKRSRLQRADELVRLGFKLMAQAEAGAGLRPRVRARLYRDGLMIACLAYRPLRLANFIGLELGRHLQRRGTGWWLEIPAAATKTRRAISLPFPAPLVPALEAYLAHWRPQLAPPGQAGPPCPALWLTEQNRGISADPCPSADHPPHPGGVRPLGQSARLPRCPGDHGRDRLARADRHRDAAARASRAGHRAAPLQPRPRHGSRRRMARHPRQHRRSGVKLRTDLQDFRPDLQIGNADCHRRSPAHFDRLTAA